MAKSKTSDYKVNYKDYKVNVFKTFKTKLHLCKK